MARASKQPKGLVGGIRRRKCCGLLSPLTNSNNLSIKTGGASCQSKCFRIYTVVVSRLLKSGKKNQASLDK